MTNPAAASRVVRCALALGCAAVSAMPAAAQVEPDPLVSLANMTPATPARGTATIEVTVVDEADRPAANTVLVSLPAAPTREQRLLRTALFERHAADPLHAMAAFAVAVGARLPLDADGHATAPAVDRGLLFAYSEHGCALRLLPEYGPSVRREPVRLVLHEGRDLRVRVVQDGGAPAAGVAVGVAGAGDTRPTWRWRTEANGTATLRLPAFGEAGGMARIVVLAATRGTLGRALTEVADHEVQFELPPCGSVEVAVADGSVPPGQAVAFELRSGDGPAALPQRSDAHGATFAFVEPNDRLVAQAVIAGSDAPLSAAVAPFAAGETARVTLDVAAGTPRLSMYVRDERGEPLRDTEVFTTWVSDDLSNSSTAHTAGDGRLEIAVDGAFAGSGRLRIEQREGDDWNGPVARAAEVPLGAIAKGRNERGDVRLLPLPVALAGVVVDTDGKPVVDLVLVTGTLPESRARTRRDGRFELRMPAPHPAAVQLQTDDENWFLAESPAQPLEFTVGAANARLVVRRAARLLVGMRGLPEDVHMDVDVEVVGASSSTPGLHVSIDRATKQLRVPAGRIDLLFRFAQRADVVYRIDGVQADAGIENHDPRLMELDWGAFGAIATIHVTDPTGAPCDDCRVRHTVRDPSGSTSIAVAPSDGCVRFFVEPNGGWLSVEPKDRALCRYDLAAVTGEHTVRLTRASCIVLRLSALPDLPEGYLLQALCDDDPRAEPVGFDHDGVARLFAPTSGEVGGRRTAVRVRLTVRHGNTATTVDAPPGLVFEVVDRALEVVVPIDDGVRRRIDDFVRAQSK